MQADVSDQADEQQSELSDERPLLSVPVAFGLALVFIAVTLGASYWLVRGRNQPSPDEGIPIGTVLARQGTVFPSPTAISTPGPAATSAIALAQQPTTGPTPVAQTTPVPISAAPTTPTPQTSASSEETLEATPTVAETDTVATAATQAAEPAAQEPATNSEAASTLAPAPVEIGAGCLAQADIPLAPAKEVADAYLHYFEVSAQALYQLDPEQLDEVTAGAELAALRKNIEENQSAGRAVRTSVQHYCVVLSVDGDNARVGDAYRDSSIYVDPSTHLPLPGEKEPDSPSVAPEFTVFYWLDRIEGVWKVVDSGKVSS
jgi:hypothetical protein